MKSALRKLKYQFDLLRHKIDENEEITLNVKTYVRHIDEENSSEYPYMRQKEVDIGSIKIFKKDRIRKLIQLVKSDILNDIQIDNNDLQIKYYELGNSCLSYNFLDWNPNRKILQSTLENNDNIYVAVYDFESKRLSKKEQFFKDIKDTWIKYVDEYDCKEINYPFNEDTIHQALNNKYYDVVEYLRLINCPWTEHDKDRFISEVVFNNN
jgi:hypothetical protein